MSGSKPRSGIRIPQDEPNPGSGSKSRYYFPGKLYPTERILLSWKPCVSHIPPAFELNWTCLVKPQAADIYIYVIWLYIYNQLQSNINTSLALGLGGKKYFPPTIAANPHLSISKMHFLFALSRIIVAEQCLVAYYLASREYSDLDCYIQFTWERNPNSLVAPTHTS